MEKSMENRERLKEQQGTEAGSLECSCLFLAISTLTTDRGSKGAEGRTEEVASRHRLKCSRVYRKQLQKGKEKQAPIPQTHTHTHTLQMESHSLQEGTVPQTPHLEPPNPILPLLFGA